jgi:chromatin remodeling complex protein RSC6
MAKKVNPALMQKLSPSPELSQVIGSAPVSRGQAIKKV